MPRIFDQQTVFDTVGTVPVPEISIQGQPVGMRIAASLEWFIANPINDRVFIMHLDVNHADGDPAAWWDNYYIIDVTGIVNDNPEHRHVWSWHTQNISALLQKRGIDGYQGSPKIKVRGHIDVFYPFESRVIVDTYTQPQWDSGDPYDVNTLPIVL